MHQSNASYYLCASVHIMSFTHFYCFVSFSLCFGHYLSFVETIPHIRCICPRCSLYFQKTRSPSYNFSVVKTFLKCNPWDHKFYLSNAVMLIWSLHSLLIDIINCKTKLTWHHMCFLLYLPYWDKIKNVTFLKAFYHCEIMGQAFILLYFGFWIDCLFEIRKIAVWFLWLSLPGHYRFTRLY